MSSVNEKDILPPYDLIIIGQGIAGTILSFEAFKIGMSIMVIDRGNLDSSSNISSGIINPVTGKRIVKSWMIDTLLPYATKTYSEMEQLLNEKIILDNSITRLLTSVEEENIWMAKCTEEGKAYLFEPDDVSNEFLKFDSIRSTAKIAPALILDVPVLLKSWRDYLLNKSCLHEMNIQADDISKIEEFWQIGSYKTKSIVFADGASKLSRSWFPDSIYQDAKGEVLEVSIPELLTKESIRCGVNLLPLKNGNYWLGSNYEWDATDSKPSEIGKNFIEKKWAKIWSKAFHLKAQRAAIRACTPDRKPYIGEHPKFNDLYLFNGLGTKGLSLTPYFANQFIMHLQNGTVLSSEISLGRS